MPELDLAEGKRLLSEASQPLASLDFPYPYDSDCNDHVAAAYDAAIAERRGRRIGAIDKYNDWLRNNGEALIAAAERDQQSTSPEDA